MPERTRILLPHNAMRREQLRLQLEKYRSRDADASFQAPELRFWELYKLEVLTRLLEDGVVDTYELAAELTDQYGCLDGDGFQNACEVIDDYCKTGGQNVSYGGLEKIAV